MPYFDDASRKEAAERAACAAWSDACDEDYALWLTYPRPDARPGSVLHMIQSQLKSWTVQRDERLIAAQPR